MKYSRVILRWPFFLLLLLVVACGKENSTPAPVPAPAPTPIPTINPNAVSYSPISSPRMVNSIEEFREEVRNGRFILPISDRRKYLMYDLDMEINNSEVDLWLFDLPYTSINTTIVSDFRREETGAVLYHEEGITHGELLTFLLWVIDNRSHRNAYVVMNSYYRNWVRFFHKNGVFYDISLDRPLVTNPVMYYDGKGIGYQYSGYSQILP